MSKYDDLSPSIDTGFGLVIINPGTGKVTGGTSKNAYENVRVFREDLRIKMGVELYDENDIRVKRFQKADYGGGRFAFRIYYKGRKVEIQMPGWSLYETKFQEGRDPFEYPRLYVEDSSWLWPFAVDVARDALLGIDE